MKNLQLEILERDINHDLANEDIWLFPTDAENKVKGFMGTGGEQKIIVLGERPSSVSHGKDAGRAFLYSVLCEYNLQDAHITDLIKSRAKGNEPYPKSISDHWRFFQRELAIIEPVKILALSKKVYDYVYFPVMVERQIELIQIDHYAYALRYGKQDKFREQIRSAIG